MAKTQKHTRDVKSIQCWPRGTSYQYYGDPHGPADQRRIMAEKIGPHPAPRRWRKGTPAEWREIRIAERALMYQQHYILWNQCALISALLDHGGVRGDLGEGFSWDSVENLRPDPRDWAAEQCRAWLQEAGHAGPERQMITCDTCAGYGQDVKDPIGTKCDTCMGIGEVLAPDDDTEYLDVLRQAVDDNAQDAEVYEWYLVDPWLCARLRDIGEVVIDNGFGEWWGRCATGQALIMDGVLQKIAAKFEEEG